MWRAIDYTALAPPSECKYSKLITTSQYDTERDNNDVGVDYDVYNVRQGAS